MKIQLIVALIFTLILNVIGVYFVNVLFYGFFILIGIYSLIAVNSLRLPKLLGHTFLLVLFSLLIELFINAVFNYKTLTHDGVTVPLWVKLISGFMTLIVSEIISLVTGGLVIYLNRNKKVHI